MNMNSSETGLNAVNEYQSNVSGLEAQELPILSDEKQHTGKAEQPSAEISQPGEDSLSETKAGSRGWRFWAIFVSLAVTALLSAMEGGIMSTALPAITRSVNAKENYVWVINVYFLTRCVSFAPNSARPLL